MAIVTTARGTQVDISPRIQENLNANVLLEQHHGLPNIGNRQVVRTPPISPGVNVIPPLQWGNWFKVPDNQFKRIRRDSTPVLGAFTSYVDWTLPNGSHIAFEETTDIRFTKEFYTWPPFTTVENCSNVSVRLSRATLPGLLDNGIVTAEQANVLLGVQRNMPVAGTGSPTSANAASNSGGNPTATKAFDDAANAAKSGFQALLVVAVVVAAIYFIPRTGGVG